MLETHPTKFAEVKIVVPAVLRDRRGYFKETFSQPKYAQIGIDATFVQDNVSHSYKGVLRGMHYDLRMAKLVQCLSGRVYDVFVDMREGSPTYKQWDGVELTGENHRQVYIPAGFAHGFYTLSDEAILMYKQTAVYDPAQERAVSWNDVGIGIVWPLDGEPVLSPKDAAP
ncbi:MAG: dTDP-4-dehydrorhamnose 3,5-epimerase [Vulcanimicrobiaceae bacterium]